MKRGSYDRFLCCTGYPCVVQHAAHVRQPALLSYVCLKFMYIHEIQFAPSVSIYTKLVEFAHRNRNRNRRWTWILLNYATCPSPVWPHTHCCCCCRWCFAFSNWLHNFIFVVVIFTSTKSGEYIVSTSA